MESVYMQLEAEEREIKVATAYRAWQRCSRARRQPLSRLAATLGVSVGKLRSLGIKGARARVRRAAARGDVRFLYAKMYANQNDHKPIKKSVKKVLLDHPEAGKRIALELTLRQQQRLVSGIKGEYCSQHRPKFFEKHAKKMAKKKQHF